MCFCFCFVCPCVSMCARSPNSPSENMMYSLFYVRVANERKEEEEKMSHHTMTPDSHLHPSSHSFLSVPLSHPSSLPHIQNSKVNFCYNKLIARASFIRIKIMNRMLQMVLRRYLNFFAFFFVRVSRFANGIRLPAHTHSHTLRALLRCIRFSPKNDGFSWLGSWDAATRVGARDRLLSHFRTIETLFKCFTVCMCIAFPLRAIGSLAGC